MPTSHGVEWWMRTHHLRLAIGRGRRIHPDLRPEDADDEVALRRTVEVLLTRQTTSDEVALLHREARGIDPLDLALMRREGVNAAALVLLALTIGRGGIERAIGSETSTPTTFARTLDARRTGGRIVETFPIIGEGVIKQRDVIVIDKMLPDIVATAATGLVGAPLSCVVSHPMLDGYQARIVDAWRSSGDRPRLYLRTDLPVTHVAIQEAEWQ